MSIIIGKDFFMNFCPICSSAEIIKTIPNGDNRERDVCQSCGEILCESKYCYWCITLQ